MSCLPTPTLSYLSSPRLLGFLGDGILNSVRLFQADSHPFSHILVSPRGELGKIPFPVGKDPPKHRGTAAQPASTDNAHIHALGA